MITPNVALSNTKDIIESIALDKGPESYIISLGCAGWGPGQLEAEIKQNAWLTYPVFEENIFKMSSAEKEERGIKELPANLYTALWHTRKSELVKEVFGEHLFNSFIKNKEIEWDGFRLHVSQYELNQYLPIL